MQRIAKRIQSVFSLLLVGALVVVMTGCTCSRNCCRCSGCHNSNRYAENFVKQHRQERRAQQQQAMDKIAQQIEARNSESVMDNWDTVNNHQEPQDLVQVEEQNFDSPPIDHIDIREDEQNFDNPPVDRIAMRETESNKDVVHEMIPEELSFPEIESTRMIEEFDPDPAPSQAPVESHEEQIVESVLESSTGIFQRDSSPLSIVEQPSPLERMTEESPVDPAPQSATIEDSTPQLTTLPAASPLVPDAPTNTELGNNVFGQAPVKIDLPGPYTGPTNTTAYPWNYHWYNLQAPEVKTEPKPIVLRAIALPDSSNGISTADILPSLAEFRDLPVDTMIAQPDAEESPHQATDPKYDNWR